MKSRNLSSKDLVIEFQIMSVVIQEAVIYVDGFLRPDVCI